MFAGCNRVKHLPGDLYMAGAGDGGFDSGLGLRGISRVRNHNPVAMAKG
jgi:hypothetical protein